MPSEGKLPRHHNAGWPHQGAIRTQSQVRDILAARGWSVSRTRIVQIEERALLKMWRAARLEMAPVLAAYLDD